jgi:hypothetical protein
VSLACPKTCYVIVIGEVVQQVQALFVTKDEIRLLRPISVIQVARAKMGARFDALNVGRWAMVIGRSDVRGLDPSDRRVA